MAMAFAEAGADLIIASRKQDACDEAAAAITEATGRKAVGIACHVAHWDDCDRLVERAYETFDSVDVLVNNAGMSPLYGTLPEVTEDLWDKVLGVNLKGPFRLCSLIGTHMHEGRGGSIINISSSAAVAPGHTELPYAAAKAALNAMTIGLVRAFAPNVRSNVIMPGPFLTDISKAWDMESFNKRAVRAIPLGRAGEPSEITGAALYLASDASSYTNGAVIKVDGGVAFSPG
jgi:NAD(P)-dependent dehydrogenase (short-subunit alcohol dehydrogenase family)